MTRYFTEPIPQKRYLMDGVYLSETGVQHMQEITIQIPKVKRQRRNNKRLSVDMLPGQRLASQMSTEGDEEKGNWFLLHSHQKPTLDDLKKHKNTRSLNYIDSEVKYAIRPFVSLV